jgi:hypothetical protein
LHSAQARTVAAESGFEQTAQGPDHFCSAAICFQKNQARPTPTSTAMIRKGRTTDITEGKFHYAPSPAGSPPAQKTQASIQ